MSAAVFEGAGHLIVDTRAGLIYGTIDQTIQNSYEEGNSHKA